MTIREVLINIRERLQNAGIEDFEYESWAFLDWKLHINRAEFYMNPEWGGKGRTFSRVRKCSETKRAAGAFAVSYG